MFDTFLEGRLPLVDQRSVPYDVGFGITHRIQIGYNWSQGHIHIGH
jgi:hypothetical protein